MSFLKENIKVILHLRQRLHHDNMLGLCLGAGISVDFTFPTWNVLVQRIAEHEEIQGSRLQQVSESLTSQTQFLFQKYRQSIEDRDGATGDEVVDYRRAVMGWLDIVHHYLYKDAKVTPDELRGHPYLWDLIPLIKRSAMTEGWLKKNKIDAKPMHKNITKLF